MIRVLLACVRVTWHCLLRVFSGEHRVCDVYDDLTHRTAAVFCSCGRVYHNDMPEGWIEEFIEWRRK